MSTRPLAVHDSLRGRYLYLPLSRGLKIPRCQPRPLPRPPEGSPQTGRPGWGLWLLEADLADEDVGIAEGPRARHRDVGPRARPRPECVDGRAGCRRTRVRPDEPGVLVVAD